MVRKPDADLCDDHLKVGRIIKAQGIKGEVKIHSFSRSPDNFKHYSNVLVRHPDSGEPHPFTIKAARSKGENGILALSGIESRNEAESLVGCEIWVARSELPDLKPGEYYWEEIRGCRVVTDDGRELGTVFELFVTGAHDVLVVRDGEREYLIPVNDEYVRFTDDVPPTVVVTPMPGLLDMNEESGESGG